MLGIIGSSGITDLGERLGFDRARVSTPYGDVVVWLGELAGRQVACLSRHGEGVTLPPHRVPYRANISALAAVGCTGLLATNAVGSLDAKLGPGSFVVPDQVIDFTWGREHTFFNDRLHSVDMTEPVCGRMRALILQACRRAGADAHDGGVYACMQGPRFETAAEIRMLRALGCLIVGMTMMPEAALARERRLCYASLCVVSNLAAGIEGHRPSAEEVAREMEAAWQRIGAVIERVAAAYRDDPSCPCRSSGGAG